MSTETALEKTGPQSTGLGVWSQAPNQNNSQIATIVPLDRENLNFFASMIRASGLVPVSKEVPADMAFNRVMAKIVAGTSYGFDPILSQSCFDVMFDQLMLNAKGQGILFKQSGEYDFRIDSHDDKHCQLTGFRLSLDRTKWEAIGTVRFDEEMAKTAQLLGKDLWKKYPRDMYFARAMTRLVKRVNPGCLEPKLILGNHFAKESQPNFNQPPIPPAPPTPELTQGSPATTDSTMETQASAVPANGHDVDHVEAIEGQPVFDGTDGPEMPGEFTGPPVDDTPDVAPPERFEKLGAIKALIEIKVGTKAKDVAAFLKGRDLVTATDDVLEQIHAELKVL